MQAAQLPEPASRALVQCQSSQVQATVQGAVTLLQHAGLLKDQRPPQLSPYVAQLHGQGQRPPARLKCRVIVWVH